jgi:hypothetical protein
MRTKPFEGGSKPEATSIIVLFPHPEGPIRETNSPFSMLRLTSESALWLVPLFP